MIDFLIDKKNYDNVEYRNERVAARGIAFKDGKLILIKSDKYGEYKFPGGGVNANEKLTDAAIREFKEETGLDIIDISDEPIIRFREIRKSNLYEEIFDHTSYYYRVTVNDIVGETNLDDYEKEYGYKLVYVTIDDAINNNEYVLYNKDTSMCPWVERELMVFKKLKEVF